jgi:hypothetical protein
MLSAGAVHSPDRPSRAWPLLVALLLAAAGCEGSPTDPLTGNPTTVLSGGGFNGAGNVGGQGGNDWPSLWLPAAGYGAHFDDECTVHGRCAVGGNTLRYGTLSEPNPGERVVFGDSLCYDCFGWISTQDIQRESGIQVHTSGMESVTINNLPEARRWELRFDYAFLAAGPSSDPASAYAVVLLVPEGGSPRELMRVNRSFTTTTGGATATRLASGGCGTTDRAAYRLGAVVDVAYPVCTGWRQATLDLGNAASGPFRIRMLVFEGADRQPVALTMDNMVIWTFQEGS